MKLLLAAINAKYIHSNPAVHSLKACAGEWASAVEIAEYTINQPVGQADPGGYLPEASGYDRVLLLYLEYRDRGGTCP